MEALNNQEPNLKWLQVAHDLKSPLTALEIIAARLKTLPPDERQLIVQAVDRIQDIVVEVLYPNPVGSVPFSQKTWGLEDLRCLIGEKNIEFPNIHFQVEITANGPAQGYIPAAPMNRVVSNLLNNAAEANSGRGEVFVRVVMDGGFLIEIEDQGPGIPRQLRGQIGQFGVSGKESSQRVRGVGLFSAFQFVERLGGSLSLGDASAQRGTIVRLDLTEADKNSPAAAG